jgi:hypothetical protein
MTSYLTIMNAIDEEIRQARENGPKAIRAKVIHELEHAKEHVQKAKDTIRDYIAEDCGRKF